MKSKASVLADDDRSAGMQNIISPPVPRKGDKSNACTCYNKLDGADSLEKLVSKKINLHVGGKSNVNVSASIHVETINGNEEDKEQHFDMFKDKEDEGQQFNVFEGVTEEWVDKVAHEILSATEEKIRSSDVAVPKIAVQSVASVAITKLIELQHLKNGISELKSTAKNGRVKSIKYVKNSKDEAQQRFVNCRLLLSDFSRESRIDLRQDK